MHKVCTVCKEEKSLELYYNSSTSEDGKAYRSYRDIEDE